VEADGPFGHLAKRDAERDAKLKDMGIEEIWHFRENTLETIKDYEQSTLYYVDIDNNLELKEEYRAKRIPMVILFQDGQIIKKWKGSLRNILDLDPEEIKEEIDELLEDTY